MMFSGFFPSFFFLSSLSVIFFLSSLQSLFIVKENLYSDYYDDYYYYRMCLVLVKQLIYTLSFVQSGRPLNKIACSFHLLFSISCLRLRSLSLSLVVMIT